MDKYVYLFELDSRRNSESEIIYAQKTLLEEIFVNGNKIVLTANQMIDSKAIIQLISNVELQKYFLTLFELNVISIYHHGDNKSISQYFQEKLMCNIKEGEDCFIFSGLPIDSNDIKLQKVIKQSLEYCDLKSMEQYIIEIEGKDIINKEIKLKELHQILNFIKAILSISLCEYGVHIEGAKVREFTSFMSEVSSNEALLYVKEHSFETTFKEIFIRSQIKLKEMFNLFKKRESQEMMFNMNLRSNWLSYLNSIEEEIEVKECMEAIIDLCYNYTLEVNIPILSKHYDDISNKPPFIAEFFNRLLFEKNKQLSEISKDQSNQLEMWRSASNLCRVHHLADQVATTRGRYEDNHIQECKMWKNKIKNRIIKNVLSALLSIVIFLFINWIIDSFVDQILISSEIVVHNPFVLYVLSFLLAAAFYFPVEFIFRVVDFTKAIIEIKKNYSDQKQLRLCDKNLTYTFYES